MKKIRYILLFVLLGACFACGKEPAEADGPVDGMVRLRFSVTTPERGSVTRAVAEDEISSVSVLVFEDTGGGYQYSYLVNGYSLTATPSETYDYEFHARILITTNDLKLYIIANAGGAVGAAVPGMTEAQVKAAITMAYPAAGFTDVLPMSGESEFVGGLSADQPVDATLLRSAARVDIVNSADNFVLNSVRVYRANSLVQVVPNVLVNNSVTTASVPAGSVQNVNTVRYTVPTTPNSLIEQLYVPESAIPTAANRRLGATAVVVGGFYDGSAVETFYRMDFIPNDANGDPVEALFGQVLRNHLYRFEITEVLAAGWPTDDDASVNPSTSIDAEIVVWDEETMEMVFDDYDYLGVSSRRVRLGYSAGYTLPVTVDTSLDTYTAYWGNADGTYDEANGPIVFGGDLDDPAGLFNAEISADGGEITFTSLDAYDEATAAPAYLVLVGGRLRIVITVTQGPPEFGNRGVTIFNSTSNDYGRFGDYRLGPNNPIVVAGTGTRGLVNMLLRDTNFGPSATVVMEGFYISGISLSSSNMPREAYQFHDVLYLPYPLNPQQSDVDSILEWLEEDDHRVLIVNFDDSNTNNNMMTTLGFGTRTSSGNSGSFAYAGTAAPEFVRAGPFGSPAETFSYRANDTTYGSVDPATADNAGYIPILLNNTPAALGNYVMAVNPDRRIIICGDCDIYSNSASGTGFYLNLDATNYTIDPANPAHVMMGNLWSWIAEVVLLE